jgi:hypothetical protein
VAKKHNSEQQNRVRHYIASCLSDPSSPISSEDWRHYEFVARTYGATEVISKLAAGYAEWPQVKREVMVAFLIEACNRLL